MKKTPPTLVDDVLFVEDGVTLAMSDHNEDGYADSGQGDVVFKFGGGNYLITFSASRLSLPSDVGGAPTDSDN